MFSFKRTLFVGVMLFMVVTSANTQENTKIAIFAGGCFWCMEPPFEKMKGVISVTSGYTGGNVANPTYNQVSAGQTGHAESIKIVYDPSIVTYKELLNTYWRNIDPTVDNKQFCDIGTQYRSAIFYVDDVQRQEAEASKKALVDSGKFKKIYTEIVPASEFYPAEDYHQDYATKNPVSYEFYRFSCGRDSRLNDLWGE